MSFLQILETSVLVHAARGIFSLSTEDEYRSELARAGSIGLLIACLTHEPYCEKLVLNACGVCFSFFFKYQSSIASDFLNVGLGQSRHSSRKQGSNSSTRRAYATHLVGGIESKSTCFATNRSLFVFLGCSPEQSSNHV